MKEITNTPREVYNAAHPFFVIDATRSRTRSDILRWALSSIPDAYIAEYVGTVMEAGKLVPVDRIMFWFYSPNAYYLDETYDVDGLTCLLDKIHVDIDALSTYVCHDHEVFAGADCQHAPIVAFPEGFVLNSFYGNMGNAERYIELMSAYGNNSETMGSSDHPKTDAPNATTEKEDN